MNWSTIREAIRQAVISSTGVTDTQWMNSSDAGQWRATPHIDLVLRSPQAVGMDETRYTFDVANDVLVPSRCGTRRFTVTVRIEAESQYGAEEAIGSLANLLRTRLFRPSILDTLRSTANTTLSSMLQTTDADFIADGRYISLSLTDIVFLAAENDTDTTDAGDYIKTVQVSSDTVKNVDGSDIDPQIALTITG